jgi:hypothetical protein
MLGLVLLVVCAAAAGSLLRQLAIFVATKTNHDPQPILEALASGGLSLLFEKRPQQPKA